METQIPGSQKTDSRKSNWLVASALVSLVLGAGSGAVFGVLAAHNRLGAWIDRAVLGTDQSTASATVSPQTIQVEEESATIEVVKAVQPAVVSVIGTQDFSKISRQPNFFSPFGDLFGQPAQPQGKVDVSGGSGFIVSSDGLILTNKHVVDTANIDYSVVLNDGTRLDATVLAKDPNLDVALLKIDKTGLPVVQLGDSSKAQVGETVIAIGNVLGQYPNSVTKGVISGLSRTIEAGGTAGGGSEVLQNTIQTDAAINQGNSGGPLLNLSGEVIGVNTAVSSQGQLVGFAIPINVVKTDITSVQASGKIVRPYMGIRYVAVTKEIQDANDLSVDYGALIVRGSSSGELAVIPGSPADKAGLVENDIILEIDGQKINNDHSIVSILAEHKPGDTLSLKVFHDGDENTVQLTLGENAG